jgi:hypothetical protein
MPLTISLQTVEDLIFYNKDIHNLLPDFASMFQSWAFGKRTGLQHIIQKALMEFIQKINSEHINILEVYFNAKIILEKTDSSIVRNYECNVDDLEQFLNNMNEFQNNLSVVRESEQVYLSFWR